MSIKEIVKGSGDGVSTLEKPLEAPKSGIVVSPDYAVLDAYIQMMEVQKRDDLRTAGLSTTFDEDVNGPWEMLSARISHYIAGGDVNGVPQPGDKFSRSVQIVTVPMAATWDDAKYGPYRLCKILGDSMPKWLPTYEPSGGNSFGDGYGTFIQSISIPAPTESQQKEIDEARLKWQVALEKVRTRESEVGERWVAYDKKQAHLPENRKLTYDTYYAKYELPILSSMRTALTGYQQSFIKKINDYTKGFGIVADMIARYSSETAMFQTVSEGVGDDRPQNVYRYSVDQSLADFKKRAAGEKPDAIHWEFNNQSFRQATSSTYWGASASYGFFCSGSAGASSSHIDWHSQSFRLVFKAKAMEKFIITPDGWYTGQLLKSFKDGPFVPNSVADIAYRSGNLWAPNGILSLRASALILIYEPSIELTISSADYQKNASEWHASGGLSIGCFSFGGNAGGSSSDIQYDEVRNTIRATDTTGVPKIIAVNNDVLPNLS